MYGYCKGQYLLEGNFTWLEKKAVENFNVYAYGAESHVRFPIECDLDPVGIHDSYRILVTLNEKPCEKHLDSPLLDYFERVNENVTYNFDTYKSTLLKEVRFKNKQCFIGSKNHELYTFLYNKSTLCSYYYEKFLGDDGITSFCYGHYSTCKLFLIKVYFLKNR